MASTRFPDKPLAQINGLTMIQHMYRRCKLAKNIEKVIVATCDNAIRECIEADGGKVIMTLDTHQTCIDRVEEAMEKILPHLSEQDSVIIVQGDEVQVTPLMLDHMAIELQNDKNVMVNLICRVEEGQHANPNEVKIVFDVNDYALFLSRSPIPSLCRSIPKEMWRQTGIMGFHCDFLKKFSRWEQTPLEMIEKIDVLRILENGHPIKIIKTDVMLTGIDTKEDLAHVEEKFKNDPLLRVYMQGQ